MHIDSEAAMAIALFASIASIGWSAAYAWAKWLHHRQGGSASELTTRLDGIERAIDAVAVEVERLGEGQRFTARLLREGGGAKGTGGPIEPYRVNTPH
jgi:hypothetical protein